MSEKCLRFFLHFVADPRLTDYDTLLDNIHGLRDGKPVQVPIYDFKSSSRIGYRYIFSRWCKLVDRRQYT